jgi:hypothetical protein
MPLSFERHNPQPALQPFRDVYRGAELGIRTIRVDGNCSDGCISKLVTPKGLLQVNPPSNER